MTKPKGYGIMYRLSRKETVGEKVKYQIDTAGIKMNKTGVLFMLYAFLISKRTLTTAYKEIQII